ncbi:MAG: peptide chain release factor N(5)-glutamine methyltransferase [Desulfovibrio sp.]|jgi:release factor glutamine methyltransferase|nr:peptide chain release factor N(5)-glutamine methyltransferase [Desulfovibrio sp.]
METRDIRRQVRSLARDFARAGVDSPRLSAELILATALGMDRQDLLRELLLRPERPLSPAEESLLRRLAARRAAGEPAAYITGRREFFGRDFLVTPAVLIPRPETELLVETALAGSARQGVLADFGTGSGCIVLSLALEMPGWRCLGLDRSREALAVARANAAALGAARAVFVLADFSRPPLLPRSLDLLAGNPPYVSGAEYRRLSREIRNFEPRAALVPGGDEAGGQEALDAIMDQAALFLRPGGRLLLEIGQTQEREALARLRPEDWAKAEVLRDLAGRPRLLAAARR